MPLARVKHVRDVILDDGWKLRPVSASLLLLAAGLSAMIVWNALANQKHQAATAAANTAASGEVIVLKYDPQIKEAQSEMLALGVYAGPVDGVYAPRTKQAIEAYQKLNGLEQTGLATPELVNHMKFTHKVQAAAQFTGSVSPAAAVDPVLSTTPQATAVYEKAAAEAADAAKAEELAVKKVQLALASLGYKIKKMDGQVSAETRSAILKYQMDNGLDMSGTVNKDLTAALKVE